MKTIADLYLPGKDVTEIVLDMGKKVNMGPLWQRQIDEIAATLQRNDPLPSYRSRRVEGSRLILECDEIDYATNLAMLKDLIPRFEMTPVCVIGVPKVIENGIVVGKLGEAFSSGMTQGIPAGTINPAKTGKFPVQAFYSELAEETGFSPGEVEDVRFLGMVRDIRYGQLAIAYGYNTRMGLVDFAKRMQTAPDHKEYTETVPIPNQISTIYRFITKSSNATGHCRGAVALHGMKEFSDSPRMLSLIGGGRAFDYFN